MQTKIVALGDIHYGPGMPEPSTRRYRIGDILLQKAIFRINTIIKPDIVLVLGDLLQDGDIPNVENYLEMIAKLLGKIQCPVITIPGNHDLDPDLFYKYIDHPPEWVDINDVRFLPFIDPQMSECNAMRLPYDIARIEKARYRYSGKLVSVQHVPMLPPGTSDCIYSYNNVQDILPEFRKHGVSLSVSAHDHKGIDLYNHQDISYIVAPGICESPFSFSEITIDDNTITARTHNLKLPEKLRLVDCHVHTEFAYCADDIEAAKALSLREEFGLERVIFTEHSGHLYVNRKDWLDLANYRRNDGIARTQDSRIEEYFATMEALCPPEDIGFEASCDFLGRPMLDPEAMSRAGLVIGSIHRLEELEKPQPDMQKAADGFLDLLKKFLQSGIQVLAHPFRIFYRGGWETPRQLFGPTVRMLREYNVAAEMNFHGNVPPPEFFQMCLDAGVKLTFGSDAHSLWQIGEFTEHLSFLKSLGFNGDLKEVLWEPEPVSR